jgi:hypothetical protein
VLYFARPLAGGVPGLVLLVDGGCA